MLHTICEKQHSCPLNINGVVYSIAPISRNPERELQQTPVICSIHRSIHGNNNGFEHTILFIKLVY